MKILEQHCPIKIQSEAYMGHIYYFTLSSNHIKIIFKTGEINYNNMLNITSELLSFQCIINIKITNEIYYILFVILRLEILCIFNSYKTSQFRLYACRELNSYMY